MANTKIRGITIELNADTAGIADGLKEINSSLKITENGLKDVNKLLKFDPDNVTLLAQKQEYLTDAISKTEEKLKAQQELLNSLKGAENANETIEQQKALEREIEATSQKLNSYQTELDNTDKSLKDMGKDAKEAGEGFQNTSDAVMALAQSEAFSKISEEAKKLYEALMACDEAADKFETSMAKVETLAHAGSGLSIIADNIKSASATIGVSSSDMAEAVYQAMSAGVASADAVQFATEASRLAIGGFTDTATAVDIVTTALNAYDMSMEDSTHIMDDLITTQNLGKTTVAELAQAMGKVIPTASAYNVNIDNLASAYAELTAKGIRTRETTTYLNAMFSELGNSEKEVNGILQEITGQTFGQYMEAGHSVGDVMKILWEYAGKDKEAFMGLWSTTQAGKAAFNLASDGGEKFNDILVQMNDNAGELDKAFGIMADTSEMLDARFNTAVENMQIAIGDALGPALDQLKERGVAILEPVTDFINANPELVSAISGIIIGVTGMTTAVTACAAAVSILKLALGDVTGIAGILGGAAILGGFAGLAATAEGANNSIKELKSNLEGTKKALQESSGSYNQNITDVHNLSQRIQYLNSQEKLNASQKTELASAVQKWNSAVDESSQLILDETGHIQDLNGALADNLELAYKQYTMAQHEAERAEILEEYAAAEQNLADAKARRLEIEELLESGEVRSASARKHLSNEYSALAGVIEENTKLEGELSNKYEQITKVVDEETKVQKENTDAQEEAAAAKEEAAKQSEEYAKALAKEVEALDNTISSQVKSFEAIKEGSAISKEQLIKNLEDNVKALENWADNLQELSNRGISDGLLQQLSQLGPEGAKQVQEFINMTGDELSRANEAWDAALSKSVLVSDTLATEYMEAGTRVTMQWIDGAWVPINDGSLDNLAAGYVDGLMNSGNWDKLPLSVQEKLKETQGIAAEAVTSEEDPTGTAMADGIVDGYTEELEARTDEMTSATQTGVVDPIKNTVTDELQMSEDGGSSQVAIGWGMSIDTSFAQGITDNQGLISTASTTMLDNMLRDIRTKLGFDEQMTRSSVFYDLGIKVDQSIADGIEDNGAVISSALQSVFDSAISSLDLSSIVAAVNKKMGDSFGP